MWQDRMEPASCILAEMEVGLSDNLADTEKPICTLVHRLNWRPTSASISPFPLLFVTAPVLLVYSCCCPFAMPLVFRK